MCSSDDDFQLMSTIINKTLNIDVLVLMGANIANDVANKQFSETTIGACSEENGRYFYELFSRAAPIPLFTDTSNTKYSAGKYLQVQVPIPSTLK